MSRTDGPWILRGAKVVTVADRPYRDICILPRFREDADAPGNGTLIASAPELLDALDRLVKYHDGNPHLYDDDDSGELGGLMYQAHAVLEKVEGR